MRHTICCKKFFLLSLKPPIGFPTKAQVGRSNPGGHASKNPLVSTRKRALFLTKLYLFSIEPRRYSKCLLNPIRNSKSCENLLLFLAQREANLKQMTGCRCQQVPEMSKDLQRLPRRLVSVFISKVPVSCLRRCLHSELLAMAF